MPSWDLLRSVWFVLIGVLLGGYSILDGLDLGVGILFPILGRSEEEKRQLVGAIGPVWDGNEVWLLTGGGALFAAFPEAYATVFSGFYLALMLVLFSLILRATALEFRSHAGEAGRAAWGWVFTIASAVPSLLFGVALGNVVLGVPLTADFEYAGNFFTLLRPFPLACGLLGLAAFALQGSTWAVLKTSAEVQARARILASRLVLYFGALFAVAFILGTIYLPGGLGKPLPWIFTAVVLGALFAVRVSLRHDRDGRAFLFSSLAFLGLWGIAGSVHYPNLVAGYHGGPALTIFNASSSFLTLKVMLILALIGMPIVIGYTIFVYRVFRGKGEIEY